MSKTAQIENIVMNILKDREWHSVKEFKDAIQECNPNLIKTQNTLSSTLYQMRTKKKLIDMDKKGVYRLMLNEDTVTVKNDEKVRMKMLELWREFYAEKISLANPSYEMDEEEFRQGKIMYKINSEIEMFFKK